MHCIIVTKLWGAQIFGVGGFKHPYDIGTTMDCLRYAKVARHTKKHIAQKKKTSFGPPWHFIIWAVVVFLVLVDAE